MPTVTYQDLLHETVLRMRALQGVQAATINPQYDIAVLTAANVKGADWPFYSYRAAILMAEQDFATTIANVGSHPWRRVMAALTAAIANGGELPSSITVGSARDVIGIAGTVRDSADITKVCTEQPLEVVRRAAQETWRVCPLYYFKIDGRYIYHTRANVVVECCVYSHAVQYAAFNANGAMLLPDVLQPAIVARAVSLMTSDEAFVTQAKVYRDYSNEQIEAIYKGLTTAPSKSLPNPTMEASAA